MIGRFERMDIDAPAEPPIAAPWEYQPKARCNPAARACALLALCLAATGAAYGLGKSSAGPPSATPAAAAPVKPAAAAAPARAAGGALPALAALMVEVNLNGITGSVRFCEDKTVTVDLEGFGKSFGVGKNSFGIFAQPTPAHAGDASICTTAPYCWGYYCRVCTPCGALGKLLFDLTPFVSVRGHGFHATVTVPTLPPLSQLVGRSLAVGPHANGPHANSACATIGRADSGVCAGSASKRPAYLLTRMTNAQVSRGARCLDGSAGSYYFKPASLGNEGKWRIFFQGGTLLAPPQAAPAPAPVADPSFQADGATLPKAARSAPKAASGAHCSCPSISNTRAGKG